jgi:acetolactate synthase-1/2/3 large subunit
MRKTAAAWLIDSLRKRGVDWMATLCGHGLDPLFEAAHQGGMRLIDTRNEQTAGYVAEGAGRLLGRPAVCASSAGVAATNLFTGVTAAWFDRAPMLAITGAADRAVLGRGCFQDFDQERFARPITRYSRRLDQPEHVLEVLDEAWQAAITAPRGPVHLQIPMDVQRTLLDEGDLSLPRRLSPSHGASLPRVEFIAQAIAEAKQPLIVAGSEAFYAGEGSDLRSVAERFAIPVQTPIWDRGVFDEESESFLGVVGAATGTAPLLEQCDLVLECGDVEDYRTGYAQRPVTRLRLDRGWRLLFEHLSGRGQTAFTGWLAGCRLQRQQYLNGVRKRGGKQRTGGRLHALDLVDAIAEVAPSNAVVLIDGGSIGQWAHQILCDRRYPSHYLTCGRSGVIGFGIGGAMASRLVYPDRPVILLSGDGSFTFAVADLECAVRQNLPFTALIADDECWGITHSGHIRQFGQGIGTQLGPIRFDQLAESLGARGVRVESAVSLRAELAAAMRSAAVTVLHAPISGGNPV